MKRTPEQVADDQRWLLAGQQRGEGAFMEPAEPGTYARLVHSVCGNNILFPATRVGCGEPMYSCMEVYRCTDCGVPFHRTCAVMHFGHDHDRHDSSLTPMVGSALVK